MSSRADLIISTVTDLVDAFLVSDREGDDELRPGEIEAAVASGEITADRIAERFAVVLKARLP